MSAAQQKPYTDVLVYTSWYGHKNRLQAIEEQSI